MAQIEIRTGISGDEQESSFMNATLQTHGDTDLSIAVHLDLAADDIPTTDEGWTDLLNRTFASLPDYVVIEVQLGRSTADDGEDYDVEMEEDEEDE